MKTELTPKDSGLDDTAAACVIAIRSAAARRPNRNISANIAEGIARSFLAEDPERFLEFLVSKGFARRSKKGFTIPKPGVTGSGDAAETRFAQFAVGVSRKAVSSLKAQENLEAFVRKICRLHGVHSIVRDGLKGALIPTGFAIIDGSPVIDAATLLVIDDKGVVCYSAPRDAIRISWRAEQQWPGVEVELSICTLRSVPITLFDRARITGPDYLYGDLRVIDESANNAIKFVRHSRKEIETIVGEAIDDRSWKGFCSSVTRRRRTGDSTRMILAKHLDSDALKVMRRHPRATFGDYFKFIGMAAERQRIIRTASAEFPFYTGRLLEMSPLLRKGTSIEKVIAKRTGFSRNQVERLRGLHWQSFGAAHRVFFKEDRDWEIPMFFHGISADAMPRNRADWEAAGWCSRVYDDMLYYMVDDLQFAYKRSIASDWKRAFALHESGFLNKVSKTAEHIRPLVDGVLCRGTHNPRYLRESVLLHVAGPNFDLAACEAFSHRWDEAAPRRVQCLLKSQVEEGVTLEDLHEDDRDGSVLWDFYLDGSATDLMKSEIRVAYEGCLGDDYLHQSPEKWASALEEVGRSYW